MELETKRTTMQANLLERRRCRLEMSSLDLAKKTVAVEMRKAQTDMRRRLKRYRERQRDIMVNRAQSPQQTMEDFLAKHLRMKTAARSVRPHTSPLLARMNKRLSVVCGQVAIPVQNYDPGKYTDRLRSKVDLRPKTAMIPRGFESAKNASRHSHEARSLGEYNTQVRYFDEEEIKDRGNFYAQLVGLRKSVEQNRFHALDAQVADFCGMRDHVGERDTWRSVSEYLQNLKLSKESSSQPAPLPLESASSSPRAGGVINLATARNPRAATAPHLRRGKTGVSMLG